MLRLRFSPLINDKVAMTLIIRDIPTIGLPIIDQSPDKRSSRIFRSVGHGRIGAPAPAIDSVEYRDFKSYHRSRGCHSSSLLLEP